MTSLPESKEGLPKTVSVPLADYLEMKNKLDAMWSLIKTLHRSSLLQEQLINMLQRALAQQDADVAYMTRQAEERRIAHAPLHANSGSPP